jgi:hypothetical protein
MREDMLKRRVNENNKKIFALKTILLRIVAKRSIRQFFGNTRLSKKTTKIKGFEKSIRKLKKENQNAKDKIKRTHEETKYKLKHLEQRTRQKSRTLTKTIVYNPSKKDLIVRTRIILVPLEEE